MDAQDKSFVVSSLRSVSYYVNKDCLYVVCGLEHLVTYLPGWGDDKTKGSKMNRDFRVAFCLCFKVSPSVKPLILANC